MLEPIFIVGCQRSGSTMLGSLLGADPLTVAIPEAQFTADLAPKDPSARQQLSLFIDEIEANERFRIWNFDIGSTRPTGEGTFADAMRWLVALYAEREGKHPPLRWIDHQPGHVREMATLLAHFPALRIIHIVRDGRAVAASIMPLAWGPNTIHTAANFWSQRLAMGLALRDFVADDRWIQVRYEDLVSTPETELRRLCSFLNIEYSPEMASGTGFRVPGFTKNQHGLVGQRPDASRLQGWKTTLTPRQIEIFEALVGPLLTYMGYSCTSDRPRLPGLKEKIRMTIADQITAIRNRRRFQQRVDLFKAAPPTS